MGKPIDPRAPLTDVELAQIPIGVQPEEDGLLACLECGRWLRGLGNHVANAHGLPADTYRQRYELPRGRGLWAADARQAARLRARHRVDRYPKARTTQFRGTQEEAERAVAAQRESWQRAGTRALKRETWTRTATDARQRTRRKYDLLAQAAGYADVDDIVDQTSHQPATVLAHLLGISASGAKWLRRYHAAGFNLDHHPPAPDPATTDELARLPHATQPVTDTHILCRVCGQWFKGLARHVTVKHQIDTTAYRELFEIPAALPLVAADPAKANMRGRRARLQRQAEHNGYADVADLIDKTRTRQVADVAAMLGVVTATVYHLRRRNLPPQ